MLHQFLALFVGFPGNQRILGIGDTALYHAETIYLIVQLHLFDDSFQQTFRICRVVNGKVGRIPDMLRFITQDT